jgi:hypothetical protein
MRRKISKLSVQILLCEKFNGILRNGMSPKLVLGLLPVNRNQAFLSDIMQHAKWQSESMIGVEVNEKTARILPMRSQRNADGMKYKKESLTSALLIAGLLC